MPQSDYILRMIERFGQFAIALRKRLLGGEAGSPEMRGQIRRAAQDAGFDLDIARLATPETLMLLVAPSGELEPARCWMCAETLFLDGLEAELSGDVERARDSFGKASMLFAAVAPMGAFLVGYPEAKSRIEEIERRVAGLDEPPPDGTVIRQRRLGPRRLPRAG